MSGLRGIVDDFEKFVDDGDFLFGMVPCILAMELAFCPITVIAKAEGVEGLRYILLTTFYLLVRVCVQV
jgi:hypothetical protein